MIEPILAATGASGDAVGIGAVISLVGLFLVVAGVRRLGTAVSMYRSTTTPVREIPQSDDPVEFGGTAEPPTDDETIDAPFSGEPAFCCTVWMETEDLQRTDIEGAEVLESKEPATRSDPETRTNWLLSERDGFRQPFVVRDGGGRVAVDPAGADLDITGHMGSVALTLEPNDSLPDGVRQRLRSLEAADVAFDCDPDTWRRDGERVRFREARLEPGDDVHVAGGAVESVPEEWGSAVNATVGAANGDRYLISKGTESSVVRRHAVQFVTGLAVGGVLLALGLHSMGVLSAF